MLKKLSFTSIEKQFSTHIGSAYAVLSHLFTVLGHYFVQRASKGFKSYQILYLLGIQLALYNYSILSYKKMPFHSKNPIAIRALLLRGLIGVTSGLFFFFGLPLVPLSEGVVVQMTTPVITGILAKFLLGERYDITLFLATIFSFSGVLLISKPDFLFSNNTQNLVYEYKDMGILLLLVGALIAAFGQIMVKKLGSLADAYTTTLYLGVCCAVGGALGQIVQGINEIEVEPFLWMAIVGLLRYFSHLFMNKSYAFGEASQISLLFYSQVPLAYLIDLFIVGVKPDTYSIIGSVVVFSSVFLMLIKNWRQSRVKLPS